MRSGVQAPYKIVIHEKQLNVKFKTLKNIERLNPIFDKSKFI